MKIGVASPESISIHFNCHWHAQEYLAQSVHQRMLVFNSNKDSLGSMDQ